MSMEDHDGPLPVPPGDVLGKYIMLRDWPRAIGEVSERLEKAETPKRRGFYHLFLATLYKMLVKRAQRRKQPEEVAGFRDKAEAAYGVSLELDPHNITARLSFAEFYLRHLAETKSALPLLRPFAGEDYSSHLSMTQQEHRRRALVGAAYALQGEVEPAREWLLKAYGDPKFHEELPYSYNSVFWTLILHKVKLPPHVVDEVLEQLKSYQNYKPKNAARFRAELSAATQP